MSSVKTQLPYSKAKQAADKIIYALSPYCKTIGCVGSLRRERPIVGDIEICCIPLEEQAQLGLFEHSTRRCEKFLEAVKSLGCRLKGNPADGRFVKIFLEEVQAPLDLFLPQRCDFYRQYAIRTGSQDYSHKIVATAWKNLGWVGTEHGLRRLENCTATPDGHSWRWTDRRPDQELPPVWESEKEFFDWLKVKFRVPKFREV